MKFSPHILLIDDNPIAVKLLTSYLQEFNYTCLSANNGKQAFDLLANYAFSLIICDLHMPVMNGYYFICEFKFLPFFINCLKFSVVGALVYVSAHNFYFVQDYLPVGFIGLLLSLFYALLCSGFVFIFSAQILKVSEVQRLIKKVLRK